jgi:maltose alpha-D-glucosyltransferase/alpha-amylase
MRQLAEGALDLLDRQQASLPEDIAAFAAEALSYREALLDRIEQLKFAPGLVKTRLHGDYHLGQVLIAKNDYYILDFEGEAALTREQRRQKGSPLQDVAGMLSSFGYAANGGLLQFVERHGIARDVLAPWTVFWEAWTCAAFLRDYLETAADAPFLPRGPEELELVLDGFLLAKACHELRYELANRPQWASIPLAGIVARLRATRQS